MSKIGFMFGYRDKPESILPEIEYAVERHYYRYDIWEFVVGSRGNFDQLVAQAVRAVKKRYPEIRLLLLAYPPLSSSNAQWRGYDSVFYPEGMENVERKYAIVIANQYMVEHADSIIRYVNHVRNTSVLLHMAQQKDVKGGMTIENLAIT